MKSKFNENVVQKKKNELYKPRSANIELLRIVTMIMIVSLHYFVFNGISNYSNINYNFGKLIIDLTYCSVDIFILISGWFYKKEPVVDFKKIVNKSTLLWLKMVFYSVIIFLIYTLVVRETPSKNTLVETFWPFSCGANWFVNSYIYLLFVSPFIDIVISKINVKTHAIAVFFIIIFVAVPAMVFPANWLVDEKEGYSVLWFVCLYFIGAFCNRLKNTKQSKTHKFIFAGGFFASGLFVFAVQKLAPLVCNIIGIDNFGKNILRYSSLPVLLAAVCALEFFANIEIKSSKICKIVILFSSVTFDVYLIHCHGQMCRNLYLNILGGKYFYDTSYMFFHFIVSVIIIYFGCSIIGLIRKKLLEKPMKVIASKAGNMIVDVEKFLNSII